MSPECVCVRLSSGLCGIDPFRGDILWSRSDIGSDAQAFGDDDHLYLVERAPQRMNQEPTNQLQGARRIRLRDGTIETLEKSFLDAYQHDQFRPSMGRRILTASGNELALYDAGLGRNVWKRTFPEGRGWVRMDSVDPSLIGLLEAGQTVLILDPADGKELLRAKLNPKDFLNAQQIIILQDAIHFYVVVAAQPIGQAQNEFVANVTHGVHAIPSGGMIYALNRTTGKVDWFTPTVTKKLRDKHFTMLQLVLERFDDLPILVLTEARAVAQNGQPQQPLRAMILPGGLPPGQNPNDIKFTSAVVAIDKATGKLIYDEVFSEAAKRPFFHTIHGDPRTGEFDVISAERTLRFSRP